MGSHRVIVDGRRDEINSAIRRHHGHALSLFGSVARGDDTDDSEIDFVVHFDTGSSLFDLIDVQVALERLLAIPADVVPAGVLEDRGLHIRQVAISM